MEYEVRKHNKPIATVIRDYLNKQGGKVTSSRKDIEWRFNALDWRYQKQILHAFLQSGKSDREWAYQKLFSVWDKCFIPTLLELWEKHHEESLTWLIIRYFPVDFLKRNFERLNEGRNYYYLCTRLYDSPDFTVDKTRLSEYDLLRIKRLMGESVTLEDAKDLFFYMVYKYCKGAYRFRAWRTVESYKNADISELTILNRPMINKMLLEIESLSSKGFGLSMELRDWRESVKKDYIAKYGMAGNTYWGDEAEEWQRNTQMIHCYECIDKEYTSVWDTFDINDQQQFLDYMKERHKQHILEESLKESDPPTTDEKTDSSIFEDFIMHFDYLDEDDHSGLPF